MTLHTGIQIPQGQVLVYTGAETQRIKSSGIFKLSSVYFVIETCHTRQLKHVI